MFSHDRGGGEKKRRVFPRKAEFGASVASLIVQPDTHTRLMVRVWDRCDLPPKRRRYEYERKLRVMEGNQPKSRCLEMIFVWDK